MSKPVIKTKNIKGYTFIFKIDPENSKMVRVERNGSLMDTYLLNGKKFDQFVKDFNESDLH